MRRWLALLIGIAALAVAGTALAFAEYSETGDEEALTDTTFAVEPAKDVEETTTTVDEPIKDEPIEPEPIPDEKIEEDESPEEVVEHEEPVDETPPAIEILYPEEGQVFEHKEVVFEGTTEPGARVFAGKYEADVNEEGAWRIVLYLGPGENLVTIKAVDEHENHATDSVTVIYEAPKEEPPKKEEPKEEPPKEEEPKEEEPKEEPHEWEFSAQQLYGECGEDPPYDVFHGTGKPGSVIFVESEYGGGSTEVGEKGGWEIKVIFESAPVGKVFAIEVSDEFGNHKLFEFIHTG